MQSTPSNPSPTPPPLPPPIIPAELLEPKRLRRGKRPLTTADQITSTPRTLEVIPNPRTEDAAHANYQVTNIAAAFSGGIQIEPVRIQLADGVLLNSGVYLLVGGAGAGKTVLSVALAMWANSLAIPASYICTFEPRKPLTLLGGRQIKGVGINALYQRPAEFVADVKKGIANNRTPKLLLYDSVTLPMKANAANWPDQATFTGGSQPSDRGFLDDLSDVAYPSNACIIAAVNTQLLPYVRELAGAVEGMINVIDVGVFEYSDRGSESRRRVREVQIPHQIVNAALAKFNFGDYVATRTRLGSTGFTLS